MDALELKQQTEEIAKARAADRFNRIIAVSVAVVAVFITACKVKDENIIQAMLAAQAQEMDHWSEYQGKSIKMHLFESRLENWRLEEELGRVPAAARAKINAKIKAWGEEVARYQGKQAELREKAAAAHRRYEELDGKDDQFDTAEAFLSLSIAIWAVSALVGSWGLYLFGVASALFGSLLGLAAFLGWNIHPEVIKILT